MNDGRMDILQLMREEEQRIRAEVYEECAKIADAVAAEWTYSVAHDACERIAAAIRARGGSK